MYDPFSFWEDVISLIKLHIDSVPRKYRDIPGLIPKHSLSLHRTQDTKLSAPTKDRRQRYIPISVDHKVIDAFPDNGAEPDFVNRAETRGITLPDGHKITTKGTISISFRFQGEKSMFQRTFHVLKRSIHDVVLRRSFLETTSTLTTLLHRIEVKAVSWSSKILQLHLLGSIAPRVSGTMNGMAVHATDDIGSDVVAISWKEAKRLDLRIHTDSTHRTLLGFADGSQVWTDGMVVDADWRFGTVPEAEPIKVNLHVLRDLTCDLILSNDLLLDNDAYSHHIDFFFEEDGTIVTTNDAAYFGMIMDLSNEKSMLDCLVAWFRSQLPSSDLENVDTMTKARRELNREMGRQLYHQERIANLPAAEQNTARNEETERRRKWANAHTPPIPPAAPSQSDNSSVAPLSPLSSVPATAPKKKRFGIGIW